MRTVCIIYMLIPWTCKIVLVGSSGYGKSTITNVSLRFYETAGGKILIDGHDIKESNVQILIR